MYDLYQHFVSGMYMYTRVYVCSRGVARKMLQEFETFINSYLRNMNKSRT